MEAHPGIVLPPTVPSSARCFCVAEAQRFGIEVLQEVREVMGPHIDWVEGSESNRGWPVSSPYLCWWCAHPFDNPPVGLPIEHDERRDTYKVVGNFCSFECACAHAEKHGANMMTPWRVGHLQRMLKRVLGSRFKGAIQRAPPPWCLQAFGGWMTIDEFRKSAYQHVRELMHNEALVEWVPAKVGITLWGRFIPGSRVTAPGSSGATPAGRTPNLPPRAAPLPTAANPKQPQPAGELSLDAAIAALEAAPSQTAAAASHLVRGMKRGRGGLDSFFAVTTKRVAR